MLITLAQKLAGEIVAHAVEEAPNECCGLVAGKDGIAARVYRVTNVRNSPVLYLMDPQEQLNAMLDAERNGWDILAIYHSHVRSEARPSSIDVRMALQSGWLDVFYLLVSLQNKRDPALKAFTIGDGGEIVEQRLEVG